MYSTRLQRKIVYSSPNVHSHIIPNKMYKPSCIPLLISA